MRITKEQEKRLSALAKSSVVGGDINALLNEVRELRELERQYSLSLGEMARQCDTVIPWLLGAMGGIPDSEVPQGVREGVANIMEYVDAVRP